MRKFYILFRRKLPTWNSTEALGHPMVAEADVGAKLSQTLKYCRPTRGNKKPANDLSRNQVLAVCSRSQTQTT